MKKKAEYTGKMKPKEIERLVHFYNMITMEIVEKRSFLKINEDSQAGMEIERMLEMTNQRRVMLLSHLADSRRIKP